MARHHDPPPAPGNYKEDAAPVADEDPVSLRPFFLARWLAGLIDRTLSRGRELPTLLYSTILWTLSRTPYRNPSRRITSQ